MENFIFSYIGRYITPVGSALALYLSRGRSLSLSCFLSRSCALPHSLALSQYLERSLARDLFYSGSV